MSEARVAGSPAIGSPNRVSTLIAAAVFAGALLLRLAGLGWGLPNAYHNQTYHPDELINYGVAQQIDLAHGRITPGFYHYGADYFIALSVVDKMVAAYGGGEPSIQNWDAYWRFVGESIWAGRLMSAFAGAGCAVVAWLILRRMTTRFGALFGAALVGIAPAFVVHSRFQTVDVFAAFWLFLSALFALRPLGAAAGSEAESDPARSTGDLRDALLAGVFAGISTGSKYIGVLVILVLWITLGLGRKPRWWVNALAGTGACLLTFLVTNPGIFLDSAKFWADFEFELGHTATGHGLVFIGTSSGFLYHLGNLVIGIGLLATLAGLVGLIYASYRRHPWAIALLAFALVYYVVIGRAEVKFIRYTFPLLLPLCVGYGYAMGTAFRSKTRRGLALTAVGVFALTGNPFFDFGGFIGAARYTFFMGGPDPRDEAAAYLRTVAPQGSVGIVKDPWFWTPPLIKDAGLPRSSMKIIYSEVAESEHPRVLRYLPGGGLEGRQDWDSRLLTDLKPDYVVFSSFEAIDEERLRHVSNLDPGTQSLVQSYEAFMTRLQKEYTQVNVFGGLVPEIHDLMYIRPTVWIWKRNGTR